MRLLLNAGAAVDAVTGSGETALFLTAQKAFVRGGLHASNLMQLLGAGADATAVTHVGYTPLYKAAQVGAADLVQPLLLARIMCIVCTGRASVQAVNRYGNTVLHVAAMTPGFRDNDEVVQMLLAQQLRWQRSLCHSHTCRLHGQCPNPNTRGCQRLLTPSPHRAGQHGALTASTSTTCHPLQTPTATSRVALHLM